MVIEGYRALSIDPPSYFPALWTIVKHACLFIDTQQYRFWQEVSQARCPGLAEGIMVRQDTGIGQQVQPFDDVAPGRIVVVLAHDHGSGAAASDDGPGHVSLEHGLPACAILDRFTEIACKAA